MKQKIIVGNWKMNKTLEFTNNFITELSKRVIQEKKIKQIIIAPSYPFLERAVYWSKNSGINISAQNICHFDNGSYTGEVSASMLYSIGVKTVILGHSERRKYFKEKNKIIKKKIIQALKNNLQIIFCIGENIKKRNSGKHLKVIKNQIKKSFSELEFYHFKKIIIAYEPIWTIGTGKTCNSKEVQKMHSYIREFISNKYSNKIAKKIKIIYGGGLKPDNAKKIFSQKDVDGGLVGNSSLTVEDFYKIIECC